MNKVKTFFYTTLLVGAFNGAANMIQLALTGKKNPLIFFKFITSGIHGKKAFLKGDLAVLQGIALHFIIAAIWVICFMLVYPKLKQMGHWLLISLIYGIIIFVTMYVVVVPLSHTPNLRSDHVQAIVTFFIILGTVSVPITLMWNNHLKHQ